MSIKKDKKFEKLEADFTQMQSILFQQFEILEEVVQNGLDGIEKNQMKTFKQNEEKIDQFELKMSDNIIQTIGLQQPMASELRLLISYFRMISHVERIGDHTTNIAENIHYLVKGQLIGADRPKQDSTSFATVEPPVDDDD